MLMSWKKYFIAPPITPSRVLSQFLWYDSYIKIDNKTAYVKFFSTNGINFITQPSVETWNILKTEYALQNKDHFCLLQLINAIPEMCGKDVSNKHQKMLVYWYLRCFHYNIINNVLIWVRSSFNSVRLNLRSALFVTLKLKQQSMFFLNIQLYFLRQILTFLI